MPDRFTAAEEAWLATLDTPARIQEFLDAVPYSEEPTYRCPLSVVRDRKAHCFDGAVFAAFALERIGYEPLLVDQRAVRDDDHVLALYRARGRWGAVAKSNFVGLRFREAVYLNLHELVMSYFEHYYNVEREKTLRSYSRPVRLRLFEAVDWRTDDAAMDAVAARLDSVRHFPVLGTEAERVLNPVDERSYRAGLLGVNEAGLWRPEKQTRSRDRS